MLVTYPDIYAAQRQNSGKVASRSPGTSCAALRCMHQSISLSLYSNVTTVGAGEEAKHIQWARGQLNSPGSVAGLPVHRKG